MKRTITLMIAAGCITLAVLNFSMKSPDNKQPLNIKGEIKIDIPADVQTVIDKSCVLCHNSDSKNTAAKLNVSFDKFKTGDYSIGKVVGKLNGIIEVIDKGSMPPGKFIENNPQRKLSDNDKKILKDWANLNINKFNEE